MSAGNPIGQRNARHFDALIGEDEHYFAWQRSKLELIRKVVERLATPAAGATIADVGCFTGAGLDVFGRGFARRIGFDISAAALKQARQRGIEARTWTIDREPCPAGDAEFDVIVAADIIEHLVDTDAFLKQLRRILRPSGMMVVTTPNLAFWLSRLRMLGGKTPWSYPTPSPTIKVDLVSDPNHIRVTTRSEWEPLFRVHGFRTQEVHGYSILPAIGGIPLRRAVDRWITRLRPNLAFGLLFVLRPADCSGLAQGEQACES